MPDDDLEDPGRAIKNAKSISSELMDSINIASTTQAYTHAIELANPMDFGLPSLAETNQIDEYTVDLFFSEYIEGSGYNKALEIYNPTGLNIDLAANQYDIQFYFNGSTSPGRTISLEGTMAVDSTFVLANGSADTAILITANQMDNGSWFNGDDAIVLRRDGIILDVIGQIGFDPGGEWGNGDTSTQNNTIRRHETNCQGDNNGADSFSPITEWVGYSVNTIADLGLHTTNCTPAVGTDLIISEYVEGDYDNKALEFYNGTGSDIDLTAGGYKVEMYFNGSSSPLVSIYLYGTVPNGDVFVLAHENAAAAILAAADQVNYNQANWYSGDDAVVLRHNGNVVDVIGQIGFDPGGQWGNGDTSTEANTLRRRPGICSGDTNTSDAFLPAETWMGFPLNSFDGLGTHETDCNQGQVVPVLSTTVITYDYDDLYRLTEASYTGDLEGLYQYAYDPVGNMKAYTETVSTGFEASTPTRVTRYFDDANRLLTATDFDLGSTSYTYDNNGNLTLIVPSGEDDRQQHYAFNQRNLMINHVLSTHGTNLQTQATFGYDGAGNRLQQVDYTGGTANTTTYANDIQGLAQVLLADNGTSQTANLFGFDLIHQQNNQQSDPLFLLTDGLGSVRQEISADAVAATTTYDPYGNVLNQSGESNTAYGYTGEQQDSATGLQYLRARYYNPTQHSFMGRDPWRGNMSNPQSMNGWSYVEGNPTNLIDPTGQTAFRAAYCSGWYSSTNYAICVRNEYGLEPIGPEDIDFTFNFLGEPRCWHGPVPYRGKGYLEGSSSTYALLGGTIRGEEVVYNFATMQRQNFEYTGIVGQDSIAASASQYFGVIGVGVGKSGSFRSWGNITDEYQGPFVSGSLGVGVGFALGAEIGPGIGIGATGFISPIDPSIYGEAIYLTGGLAVDPVPGVDFGGTVTNYTAVGGVNNYKMFGPFMPPHGPGATYVEYAQIQKDITLGVFSPWIWSIPFSPYGQLPTDLTPTYKVVRDMILTKLVSKQVDIFNQIRWYSFE